MFLLMAGSEAMAFDASPESGTVGQGVSLELVSNVPVYLKMGGAAQNFLFAMSDADKAKAKFQNSCGDPEGVVTSIAISFIIPITKYVYGQVIKDNVAKINAIKKRTSKSYSSTVVVDSAALKGAKLMVLTRFDKKSKEVGLLSVVKIIDHDKKAFTFFPCLTYAKNAVAETKATKRSSKKPPTINAAIAIAVKATTSTKPGIVSLGEGSVGVNALSLGNGASIKICEGDEKTRSCDSSPLIAFPEDSAQTSVTMSVAEQGSAGFDIDIKAAKFQALAEALADPLQAVLETKLGKM